VKKSQARTPEAWERRNWPQGRSPPGRGGEPRPPEDGGDRGGRETDAQAEELALDPPIAPPGILPGQAQDQAPGLGVDGGPAGPPVRFGPLPSHQVPVPSKERLRPDHERAPYLSGEEPARRGHERPVRPSVHRSLHLTPQDGQLVTEDGDLQIGLSHRILARPEQDEDTAQEKVEEGSNHGGALSQMTV
jgi:hypothetical protein